MRKKKSIIPFAEFHGYIPEIPNIAIDNFTLKRPIYFLSHFHADHYVGLDQLFPQKKRPNLNSTDESPNKKLKTSQHSSSSLEWKEFSSFENTEPITSEDTTTYPIRIYCTAMTKHLLLLKFNHIPSDCIIPLSLNQFHFISISQNQFIQVLLLNSNHCAGSVMFCFCCKEWKQQSILYTGDLRFDSQFTFLFEEEEENCRQITNCLLQCNTVYLDCTFCDPCFVKFPTRSQSIQQCIELIRSKQTTNPFVPIYITCEMLGTEPIILELCTVFKCKVYLDKENMKKNRVLELIQFSFLKHCFTEDKSETVFRIVSLETMYEMAMIMKQSQQQNEMLFIRLSTAWTSKELTASQGMSDSILTGKPFYNSENGIWYVIYSIHSSFEELQQFLYQITPKAKQIIPLHGKTIGISSQKQFYQQHLKQLTDFSSIKSTTQVRNPHDYGFFL